METNQAFVKPTLTGLKCLLTKPMYKALSGPNQFSSIQNKHIYYCLNIICVDKKQHLSSKKYYSGKNMRRVII